METIRDILKKELLHLEETVYSESKLLDYPIAARGEWGIKKENLENSSYQKIEQYRTTLKEQKKQTEYREIIKQIESIPENTSFEEKKQKKLLRKEKGMIEKKIKKQVYHQYFQGEEGNVWSVTYKRGSTAMEFDEIVEMLPVWQEEKHGCLRERPWFVSDLGKLKSMLSSGKPIGMEGGSCLIGSDELVFCFHMKEDRIRRFDFNTMQEIIGSSKNLTEVVSTDLWEFVKKEKQNIQKIDIECKKEDITIDEYETLDYLFLLASVTDAKLVVTIPDMSYEKTFLQLFGALDETLFFPLQKRFLEQVYRISDLSLQWIAYFQQKYQKKDVVVFHGRDKQMCEFFYQARSEFLDSYVKKHLTGRAGVEEALMDYICMPAMPFYLWGLQDVIEVNRMEEYPSIEKCKRIHKSKMHLHYMLFPQKLSKNQKTSSFYADRENKEYVDKKAILQNAGDKS